MFRFVELFLGRLYEGETLVQRIPPPATPQFGKEFASVEFIFGMIRTALPFNCLDFRKMLIYLKVLEQFT